MFSYTIISYFTNTYRLSDVRESPITPDEWNIFGTDQFGGVVVAGYSPLLGMFSLFGSIGTIDQFFTFDFIGSNTVSGCYYHDSDFSRCYPMTGVRTSSTALTRLTPARPSTSAAQAELGEVGEAERLEEDAERMENEAPIEIDPKIIRVFEGLREVLRQ